jgi:hypothetical protein
MMIENLNRPRQIIEYCLAPLALDTKSEAYKDTYRRLDHVIRTYQSELVKAHKPVAVDFSQMRTITINEDAHGQD